MKTLKKNQSGFGAVELVLVLVIVILLGVVGWFVYKNHNKTTNSSTTTSSTPTTTSKTTTVQPAKQTKTYADSIAGYSFEYPKDWTVSVKKDKGYYGDTLTYFNIVTVKSPDYKDNGVDGMGNVITKGGDFLVQATPTSSDTSQDICKDAEKCITVDGQKAGQHTFNPGPEGGYWVETDYVKSKTAYLIDYSYAKGGQSQYLSLYNAMLVSFKSDK